MKQLYVISYDNFYNSSDITSLDKIESYIQKQLEIEKKGELSRLFSNCCSLYYNYINYELKELENGDYELILNFDDDFLETSTITLVKCDMYL